MKIREYKAMARKTLIGKYGLLVLAQILMGVLVGALIFCAVFSLLVGMGMFISGQGAGDAFAALLGAEAGFVVLFLLLLIAGIVLSYMMGIGYIRLCLNICRSVPHGFSDLFYGFRKGSHPLRYLGVNLLLVLLYLALMAVYYLVLFILVDMAGLGDLGAILWSAVWLIGYCWVLLGFSFAPLIVIDKPETRVMEALSESRRLLKRRKLKYFLLCLSFILWFIPLYLTFGIASIWIYPYMTFTELFFYLDASGELYVSDWEKPSAKPEKDGDKAPESQHAPERNEATDPAAPELPPQLIETKSDETGENEKDGTEKNENEENRS